MGVKFSSTDLPGVLVCELDVYPDDRGFFAETYREDNYTRAGIKSPMVQDNFAFTKQYVLRGLHYQLKLPQAKLVSAIRGVIYDVAVDIRKGSPTFGKWAASILSDENKRQLYIPEGFAHGYCVLSDTAEVVYKCSNYYDPSDDRGINWADEDVAVEWPIRSPSVSDKDKQLPTLKTVNPDDLPEYVA